MKQWKQTKPNHTLHLNRLVNLRAFATHTTESITRLASVGSVTSRVDMFTEPFGTFVRAGNVRGTCIVGDVSNLLDELYQKKIGRKRCKCMYVCVCVCVCERERERERERTGNASSSIYFQCQDVATAQEANERNLP